MRLTDHEKAMLDGKEVLAVRKAMELLVRYGEALGAERLVDTNNVCGANIFTPTQMRLVQKPLVSHDAVFAELSLDSPEVTGIPMVKAYSCQLIGPMDTVYWPMLGLDSEACEAIRESESFSARHGIQLMCTCTPYQVGNVPVKGEHCAWMESSAVVYINSVLGARSNVEGRESTGAAMLTGKIPYWGYHLEENRRGTHLVTVDWDVESVLDWGLLGYYTGEAVDNGVPVLEGTRHSPNLVRLKHFGAAAASSGGVELYHIPRVTAEAQSREEAFGGKKPAGTLKFGAQERKMAYEALNSNARDNEVDLVVLGCPHASIQEIWEICRLLEGKRVHENTRLWVFTPRAIREIAGRNGYTAILESAGAFLMSDTCPAIRQFVPPGTKVIATNSAKQAHYLPAMTGVQGWFGSLEDCIAAAVTGRWKGGIG